MVDLNPLADPSLDPLPVENETDLEQRLGLYQVFLKLYEHHRELLDEILDLENTDRSQVKGVWQYIQAGVEDQQIYLVTNLLQGRTQKLFQPQNCWIIGRDRKIGLSIQDKRLSRRHAMIRYVQQRGFYLSDLNSTNGTYLNGEPVRRPILLKEGDRIRLGSLSFIFFMTMGCRYLPAIAPEFLEANNPSNTLTGVDLQPSVPDDTDSPASVDETDDLATGCEKDTFLFAQPSHHGYPHNEESGTPDLSTAQKSDILDRFLNR